MCVLCGIANVVKYLRRIEEKTPTNFSFIRRLTVKWVAFRVPETQKGIVHSKKI